MIFYKKIEGDDFMALTNSQCVINHVKKRKSDLIKVFHSKCCICGFDAYQEALEFHHVNPEEKSFGLTDSNAVTKALSKQLEEAKKCILVCANCHRGIHNGHVILPSNYKDFYDKDIAQQLLDELQAVKTHKKYYCQRCGKTINRKATFCPECAKLNSRKVNRPSRDDLKALIREKPFTQIALQFSVTDNTIRKWCDAYDLPRKVSDIKQFTDQEWEKI